MVRLDRSAIVSLLHDLDRELCRMDVKGEIYAVGGAVLCLAMNARDSTRDIDAVFRPASEIRKAAQTVADGVGTGLEKDWLNDAVKEFMSPQEKFQNCMDLPNLRVMTAHPEYLFAMKVLSMRLEKESKDLQDIKFLIGHLQIPDSETAFAIVGRYYPMERIPQKSLYGLQEIFENLSRNGSVPAGPGP